VKLVTFEPATAITHFDSHGATIAGIANCAGQVRVSALELEAGGLVGMHEAACPQLFLVVAGSGWTRAGDGERIALASGEAVFWETGELHESGSDAGLTAIVVEAESLELLLAVGTAGRR
jgi:quercetin dioxygenase-like cupin family protein